MNERFEELKRRAVAEADTSHIDFDKMSHAEIQMLGDIAVEKKFAELIVRECCQYLDNEAERLFGLSESEEDPVFQSNFEICAEKCYDNIQGLKEHFGVEE
jgi:hypothetical protein